MWKAIWTWLKGLFKIKIIVPDSVKETAGGTETSSAAAEPVPVGGRATYWTPGVSALGALIRSVEAGPAGYNADYRNDDHWILTNRTLSEVQSLGKLQVTQGEGSSAIGGYQFISTTLSNLRAKLKLTGKEIFDTNLQDDLAYTLMCSRGLTSYKKGLISAEAFANGLAKEWASLPVVTAMQGAHRKLKIGQSYYAGDGLNKALLTPSQVLAAIRQI